MLDGWRLAFRIRRFEERLLTLFAEGRVPGTVHTCCGQEWSGIAFARPLRDGDYTLSNHRGHGHFLARNPDKLRALLAEVMGLDEGLCGGAGGSQHLYADNFISNGVQGGMTPIAAGLALAQKIRKTNNIVVVFIGDGTTGEGILYEAMNIAAMWRLPVVYALERNGYAQSTDTATTIAGDIALRARGFGLSYNKGDVWHPDELCRAAEETVAAVRGGVGPALFEIECFRLNAHSKGDDLRPADLVAAARERDPLAVFSRENPTAAAAFVAEADAQIAAALAAISPTPCRYAPPAAAYDRAVAWSPARPLPEGRYGETIHRALARVFEDNPLAVMLGEDIEPPYGGAFKITRDLATRFPGRVRNTPISEAAITGVGTGLALAGCRPLVEIMFGDFLTLAFDQLQQHAAKFPAMSGGRARVPLIVRTPMGGRRGYGPTHSQSLEKHFLGIPGLTVAALNARLDPGEIYPANAGGCCGTGQNEPCGPLLAIENKALYGRIVGGPPPAGYVAERTDETPPVIRLSPERGGAGVTIACYGGMLEVVEAALAELWSRDEVLCEVLCYSQIYPFNRRPLLDSLSRTCRLLTVEEGPGFAGWGAEVVAQGVQNSTQHIAVDRLGYDGLVPASAAREAELLPGAEAVRTAVLGLL